MLALQEGYTVPQIFFNDKHIGGATETLALLEQWDKEEEGNVEDGTYGAHKRYQREIVAFPDPNDPRLATPPETGSQETPAWMTEPPRANNDLVQIPVKGALSVLEVTSVLETALAKEMKLKRRGCVYRHVAPKSKLLEAFASQFGTDGNDSEEVLTILQARRILHPMLTIKSEPYFRLQAHHTPHILNSFRIWTDRVDPDGLAIVRRLTDQLNTITSRHDSSSGATDLMESRRDVDYNKLLEATCELQKVDMSAMSVNVRTAFVINIYNLFIRIAQIHVGVGNTDYQRLYYFSEVSMEIGGQIFGFHDLESGILRGNRAPPYALHKPFGKKDGRLGLALKNPDCRIHFGLNCGAASCPPVKEFTAEGLDEELRIVALAFCGQDEGVKIVPNSSGIKGGEVQFTTIMNWYMDDFGGSKANLPFFVMKFLTGEKKTTLARMLDVDVNIAESDKKRTSNVNVKFMKYDWSPHGVSNLKSFVRSDLKAEQYSACAILS